MTEPDDIKAQRIDLLAHLKSTQKLAMQISKEASEVMRELGWCYDATIEKVTEEGKSFYKPRLLIRTLTLEEWQAVQKEKLRKSLLM